MSNDANLDGGRLWTVANAGLVIPASNSFYFAMHTGNKAVKFSSRQFSSSGDDIKIWTYEGLGFSLGTVISSKNRNRIMSENTPSFEICAGVTPEAVVDDPTDPRVLSVLEYVSNTQNYINENLADEDSKWLFKPNTDYVIRLENADASDANFSSSSTFEEMIWSATNE